MPAGEMHLWGTVQVGKVLYVTHVQDANVPAIDVVTGIVRTITTGRYAMQSGRQRGYE
jgi:hypothetical protein